MRNEAAKRPPQPPKARLDPERATGVLAAAGQSDPELTANFRHRPLAACDEYQSTVLTSTHPPAGPGEPGSRPRQLSNAQTPFQTHRPKSARRSPREADRPHPS